MEIKKEEYLKLKKHYLEGGFTPPSLEETEAEAKIQERKGNKNIYLATLMFSIITRRMQK